MTLKTCLGALAATATLSSSAAERSLNWEETELPSYGAVSSNPGSAPRRMRLLRWTRTGEFVFEMRDCGEREREGR